ncbi:glucose dehydrogenase [FAD, quinone] [Diabrotica virgifera virgifera]|uniref:Glucose dehydrogenase [FAD, quinone]-like n=1 Tax=Diabrotica virgifera virgifera TaxID=50390 RepID=A0A6P7FPC1_DIAVI|nr:glucose dehydrogenase [FAD, quinone] [Diabrotica virgifera virgifera]
MDTLSAYIPDIVSLENIQGAVGYLFLASMLRLFSLKSNLGNEQHYPEDYGPKLRDGDEFDFIVIGAGSAGSVVANKLSENAGWRVLVLEAGGYPSFLSDIPAFLFSLQGTDEDWQYKTEPSETSCLAFKDGQCRWPRGKVLGGTSTINAMLYMRGDKRDYDHWAELGNVGWDWNSVLEHYKQLENMKYLHASEQYGRDGLLELTKYDSGHPITQAITEANELLGYPVLAEENPERPLGSIIGSMTISEGARENSAKAFLGRIKERVNLYSAIHSYVQKIVIDPETKSAKAVEVKIGEKIVTLKAKKEIILSAGAINSPQVLMLSGLGPKEHLQELGIPVIKNLPVGYNLEDHVIHIGFDVSLKVESLLIPNKLGTIYKYFRHNEGELAGISMTNLLNFINTKNDSAYPNICYHYFFCPPSDPYLLPEIAKVSGLTDEIFLSKKDAAYSRPFLSLYSTVLNPKSKGRILLRSKDPGEKPLIHAGYFTDQNNEDIEVMLESIRYAEKLIDTPPFKQYDAQLVKLNLPKCEKYEYRSDDYWKCSIRHLSSTIYHPVGTCKMAPKEDGSSVVDSRLRVHGVKNLRVADASIMPKIVSANTNAPSMMIGHKAAVMIMGEWGNKHEEL